MSSQLGEPGGCSGFSMNQGLTRVTLLFKVRATMFPASSPQGPFISFFIVLDFPFRACNLAFPQIRLLRSNAWALFCEPTSEALTKGSDIAYRGRKRRSWNLSCKPVNYFYDVCNLIREWELPLLFPARPAWVSTCVKGLITRINLMQGGLESIREGSKTSKVKVKAFNPLGSRQGNNPSRDLILRVVLKWGE